MRCLRCESDNPEFAKFCAQCGAPMERLCTACGAAAPPSARFCMHCGVALDVATEPAGPATPPAVDDAAERRQVTVMFCDLVGSTSLSTRLDPEDLRAVQRRYRECCTSLVERYEGFIARYMGDGILAYFGYPRAHEDDAERAVRAALAIVARVPDLAGPPGGEGEALAVRVGIATGPVVIGDLVGEGAAREHDVIGETPNLAARLQSLAGRNEVVVGDDTRRLVGAAFEIADLGAHDLKGFPEPVHAYRVAGTAAVESRFEATRGTVFTPFVGRAHEMNLVRECWRNVILGEGRVLLLTGEAGIGKSRITLMTRDLLAADEPVTIRCQCSPYHQSSALYPVVDHLARGAGLDDDDGASARLDKLEHLLGLYDSTSPEDMALFATLLSIPYDDRYPPIALEPEALRARTLDALQRAVQSIAARRPLFFLVEDVHWCDPTTLELVENLVERVREWRCLLMITSRSGFDPPWCGEAHVSQINLNRLDRRQCEAMIDSLSGMRLPAEILEQIAVKTDGIPLFVEELTRTIIDSGMVTAHNGEYVLDGPLQPLQIPATLQDSLMARLDRLDEAKTLAQLGAVIGREFSRELLSRVSERPPSEVDDVLARLVESQLVFRRGSGSRAVYVFKHALVRDAAYNSLLKSRRHQLHHRIARALLEHFPDLADAQPELVAEHYLQAGADEESLTCWHRAADRAMSRSAFLEAIAHLRKGLACLERLGLDASFAPQSVALRIKSAECMRVIEQMDEAFAMLDEARQIATRFSLTESLASIHHLRGNLCFPLARFEECLESHRLSHDFARAAGSVEREVQALGGLGDANYLVGRMRTAGQYFSRCVDMARQHHMLGVAAANWSMVGFSRAYLLELEDARNDAVAAVALAAELAIPRAELTGWQLCGLVDYQLGHYARAIDEIDHCLELIRRIGARRFESQAGCWTALCLYQLGRSDEAMARLDQVEEVGRRYSRRFTLPMVLGAIALVTPDASRRERVLLEGESILDEGAVAHNHMLFAISAIDACLRHGEWDRAQQLAQRLDRFDRGEPLPWSRLVVDRGLALARWGRGERGDDTLAALTKLAQNAARCGFRNQSAAIEAAIGER